MLDGIEKQQAELRRQEQVATQERAALAARVEALRVGLNGKDATSALLAATDRLNGLLGSVATLVRVQSPYQTAIAAAFGAAADAVAVTGLDAAMAAFDHLKAEDLGTGRTVARRGGRDRADRQLASASSRGTVRRRAGRGT